MKQLVITLQENEDGSVTGGLKLPSPVGEMLERFDSGEETDLEVAAMTLMGFLIDEGMLKIPNREEAESAGPSTDSPVSEAGDA